MNLAYIIILLLNKALGNEGPLLRFDMHAAFRPCVEQELLKWTRENESSLKEDLKIFRPRVGVFAQAECCAKKNKSGEFIIPTFTANFLAQNFEDAHLIMNKIMDAIGKNSLLKDNFLRVRSEGQLSAIKFTPQNSNLAYIQEKEESYLSQFPQFVKDDQYYDAHIHLKGITSEKLYLDAAMLAAKHNMPIIVNILKIRDNNS